MNITVRDVITHTNTHHIARTHTTTTLTHTLSLRTRTTHTHTHIHTHTRTQILFDHNEWAKDVPHSQIAVRSVSPNEELFAFLEDVVGVL